MSELTQEQKMKVFHMFVKTIRDYAENNKIKEYKKTAPEWSNKYNTRVVKYTVIVDIDTQEIKDVR